MLEIPTWLLLITDWITTLTIIFIAVGSCIKPVRMFFINIYQKNIKDPNSINKEKIENLERGMKAVLGSHIYEKSQAYIKKGSITPSQMEDMNTLYESYTALHGNGTVKKLYNECEALPTRTENE